MKKLLIFAFLGLVVALGVITLTPKETKANEPSGGNVYPHSTGSCYCGTYWKCHPKQYSKFDSEGFGQVFEYRPGMPIKNGMTPIPNQPVVTPPIPD